MATEIKENKELLEREIREILPQIPYVIDQVGAAMDWVKSEQDEGSYIRTLQFVRDVAKFTTKISNPNFYKTHLVVAALLMDLDNPVQNEKFSAFKSASNSVENSLNSLRIDPKLSEDRGCFKAVTIHVSQVARKSQELFTILMYSILHELKEIIGGMEEAGVKTPITAADYIKILGYAGVMANLRMANLEYSDATRSVVNEIEVLLNNKVNY